MELSIVIGSLNQHELTRTAVSLLHSNLSYAREIIIIDNGSEVPFTKEEFNVPVRVIRNKENKGNYPLFEQGAKAAKGDIVAFLHNDVFVYQKGWDESVIAQFEAHAHLGLVGFIGSTEIDAWGGRGMGTVSNMQGRTVERWTGSAGHHHGRVSGGMTIDGSVVDGCVMIFRKSVLERLETKYHLPPHHFYDRIMSCQVVERGYKVGILGIEFDHVSGQVANQEQGWQETSRAWFKQWMDIESPQQWVDKRQEWVMKSNNPSRGKTPDQWDHCAYLEAEYQFLSEFRDTKRIVPMVYGRKV